MKNKKRIICNIFMVVFLLIFMVDNGVAYDSKETYVQMTENMAEAALLPVTTIQPEEPDILTQLGITVPEKGLDWDALHLLNEDIYAWIYIPNTNIDYPILQHPTDVNYYIDYNLDGTKGYPGCICTQYYNSKEFNDPNTIIYGHNMKNGTMFRTLHNYEDKDFFNNNPYVYIYTPETTYVYEIFATSTVSNKHLMSVYNFWEEKGFNSFIKTLQTSKAKTSYLRKGSEAVYGDYLLTLSTCNGNSKKRWIVVGKRLN